ncbi:DNA translocase FtsK, partial [Bosea sp. BH3]|uniref:DNA translocase FtsK n=1 Tax=Bosea sp. BH3 TaxID=2871701 RepID=UPI0021CB1A05
MSRQARGSVSAGVEAAQNSAFYLAPNVRFTRTPDKARLSQRAPASEPAVEAAAEPASAAPSRVRYTRTPNHLFKQVWGDGQSEAAPVSGHAQPDADAENEQPFAEFEQASDVEAWDEAASLGPDEAADPASQPFAFISDHAFWELGPDPVIEGADLAPGGRAEDARPFEAVEEWRDDGSDQTEQIAPRPAAATPRGTRLPVAPSFAWTQSYSVSLRVSLGGLGEPTRGVEVPAETAPPPEPAAAVAQRVSAQKRGVLVRKRAVVEPALPAEEPGAAPASHPVATHVRPRLAEIVPVSSPSHEFELPPITFLAEPQQQEGIEVSIETLQQNAGLLEGVLEDFNIRGEIVQACPGPVVTLYELEPAPGTKSSRVISLADDIARSMSAISARVAVVQGKNAIGIELPNNKRETVFLRELIASQDFESTKHKLALCLGKTIGGEPVIADLARMPHLLVAGTT